MDWTNHYDRKQLVEISNKIIEELIKSLLHEHKHSLQNRKKFKQMYDDGKIYQNHPYEKAAIAVEKNWKKYLKYLDNLEETITLPIEIGDTILTGKHPYLYPDNQISATTLTSSIMRVRKFENDVIAANKLNASSAKLRIETKDIDFGSPSIEKILYKIFYKYN